MRKFTNILENINNSKHFEISAEIKILIIAESEGEAGYLADSILGGVDEQSYFTVKNISEISKEEYQKHFEGKIVSDIEESSDEDKIVKTWEAEFGDREPNAKEKIDFLYNMKKAGFSSDIIATALENKMSKNWIYKKN